MVNQDDVIDGVNTDQGGEDQASTNQEQMRSKMLAMLKVYPIISPAMMQVAMGTATPPIQWRPVLEDLISEGKIIREEYLKQSHLGQNRSYTRLRLPETPREVTPVQE